MKAVTLLVVALSLSLTSMRPVPQTYIDRLKGLRGTPYAELDCAQFINAAHQPNLDCTSQDMYKGCFGTMAVVADVPTVDEAERLNLQAGDVLDFHGVHVAVYVGDGQYMDSDPAHGGVGDMKVRNPDAWFQGPVRILRWKR